MQFLLHLFTIPSLNRICQDKQVSRSKERLITLSLAGMAGGDIFTARMQSVMIASNVLMTKKFFLTFGAKLCYPCNGKFMKKRLTSVEIQCLWALRAGVAVWSSKIRRFYRAVPFSGVKFRWDSGTIALLRDKCLFIKELRLKLVVPFLSHVGQGSLTIRKMCSGAANRMFWCEPRYNLGNQTEAVFR